jgi:hypothetical protein
MTSRKLRDAGVLPIFAYPLLLAGFIVGSFYLFGKIEYAEYFYLFITCFFVFRLSEERRNDFLKICFGDGFRKIRIAENLIISLPNCSIYDGARYKYGSCSKVKTSHSSPFLVCDGVFRPPFSTFGELSCFHFSHTFSTSSEAVHHSHIASVANPVQLSRGCSPVHPLPPLNFDSQRQTESNPQRLISGNHIVRLVPILATFQTR